MNGSQDREHLRLLSIFHYVAAGITALVSLIPVFHLIIGILMVTGALEGEDPEARVVGWFFAGFALLFILAGLTLAGAMAYAGRNLARHTRYTACFVVAAVECVLMPYGTVLGVFTLIVLVRPSVKALFGAGEGPGPAPAESPRAATDS